jgi:hypothetical protein
MTMDRFLLDYSEMSLEIADRGGLSKMDNLLKFPINSSSHHA